MAEEGMSPLSVWIRNMFRPGMFPLEARAAMEDEDLLFLAEGVRTTVLYHKFKAPGRYFLHKHEVGRGALAVSSKRIAGYVFRKRVINLPFEEINSVKISCIDNRALVFEFDPGLADPKRSGRVDIRYHTDRAAEAYGIIRDLRG